VKRDRDATTKDIVVMIIITMTLYLIIEKVMA